LALIVNWLIAGHKAGKAAIEAVRSDLPVGISLAMFDDQALGPDSLCDAKRQENYGAWLDVAKSDDFLGVQNCERVIWDSKGKVPPPAGRAISADRKSTSRRWLTRFATRTR
jgi:beta-glucosidase